MSFFKTLNRKLTTDYWNGHFFRSIIFSRCMDTIHIELKSHFKHTTKHHNITVSKMQFTHYIWDAVSLHYIHLSSGTTAPNDNLTVALLLMHSIMETDKQYSMFRSWNCQENKIHWHQILWIYWRDISSSGTVYLVPCFQISHVCRPL